MLSADDMRLAQHLDKHKAIIMTSEADAYPAYPRGDRRKRPVCWVSQDSFKALSSFGGIKQGRSGYALVDSFARRCRAGGDFAGQHRTIKERELYLDSGVKRKARINRSLSALDRLHQRRNKTGASLLSDAEYEAGRQFAQDYTMAHYDHISTQNYMSAGVNKTGHYSSHEDHLDRRIDARKRFERAKAIIGPGLEKAVIAVCCHEKSLDQVERAEKWAASSGLTVLKLGLSALIDYYGTRPGVR